MIETKALILVGAILIFLFGWEARDTWLMALAFSILAWLLVYEG